MLEALREAVPSRSMRVVLVLAVGSMSGCATYLDAKLDTAPGGRNDRDRAAAAKDLQEQRKLNDTLQDEKLRLDRDIQRNQRAIQAQLQSIQSLDGQLSDALNKGQVSRQQHAQLKRQLDALQSETRQLDLANKSSALAPPDPKAEAEKQAKLRELEKRKKDLEAALQQMTVRK